MIFYAYTLPRIWDTFLTPSSYGFYLSSWDIGEWSECSKTCGLGMQHRQVLCRQIYANRTLNVHTSRCRELEQPEIASACQLKICSEWQIRSEWTAVSSLTRALHLADQSQLLLYRH